MRAGRTVTSPITTDSADSQVIAYIDGPQMHTAMVAAFIDALRTGIPTRLLPGSAMFASKSSAAVVDVRDDSIERWQRVLAEATGRVKRATAFSLDADATDDEVADYRAAARKARADAEHARTQLATLAERPEVDEVTGEFDVYTDVWVPALAALGAGKGRLSQEARQAFEFVVPDMAMSYEKGQWWGEATLRVNTSLGTQELGPIRWCAGRGGTATPLLALNIPRPVTGRGSTKALIAQLEKAGVSQKAANTVTNSVFAELSEVLLQGLGGASGPWPAWVGPQWQEPRFVDWVVKTYTDPNFRWLGNGRYATADASKQLTLSFAAAVHHAHAAGQDSVTFLGRTIDVAVEADAVAADPSLTGTATGTDAGMGPDAGGTVGWFRAQWLSRATVVVDVLQKINTFIRPHRYHQGASRNRAYQPVLRQVGQASVGIGARWFAPVLCECGMPPTVFARVPEVPRDLLCSCGRMPQAAAHGMDPAVRFPDEYLRLRLSDEACRDVLTAGDGPDGELLRASLRRSKHGGLTSRQRNVLRVLARPEADGPAMDELGRLAGVRNGRGMGMTRPLQQLAAVDLISSTGLRPIRWWITERGRAVAETLGPDLEEVVKVERRRPAKAPITEGETGPT